jgi:large subunit ribosomal protein L21
MYAVIETGGKQYQATPGQTLDVEKLPGAVGEQITLDRVLLVADGELVRVGRPVVPGVTVLATVVGQRRYRKVLHFQYEAKKRERKKTGHRQHYTRLQVVEIQG